jgi:asparagine synthase (glutamine-hydrolysing)
VEFVLTIPSHIFLAPGEPRRLMRRALQGVLPEKIHRRFSKGYAAPYLARSFQETALSMLPGVDDLWVVRLGYVDPGLLRERLSAFLAGSHGKSSGILMQIAMVESWLDKHAHLPSTPAVVSSLKTTTKGGEHNGVQHS